ncbi:MAG: DUF1295 domain-containing protein [Clostridiales bacterium]|nr:DUF1295 domain-containing protein [Clostridiales bacterium]
MSKKTNGLLANVVLYILAFAIALIPFCLIDNIFLAEAAFTATATLVIYIVTCFVPDTSLYDPYWSVAPPVMLLIAMIKYNYWSTNAIIILSAFLIWSTRLTGNWVITYKGLLHEDWRYKMYRDKCTPFGFAVINFVGLQFVPTIVVYAGMIGAFNLLGTDGFSPAVIPGITVMILGVSLEFVSDRAIHRFLRENKGQNRTCDVSIWHYSRHPNYLGEMTFWTGVFISFACVLPDIWYFGLGFFLIILLFLTVSIPMMEKHNMERRPDYEEYKARTSVLIPLPNRKNI